MSRKDRIIAFSGIGIEIVVLMVAATQFGSYLDHHYPLQGLWTAALVVLALVGWVVHITIQLKALSQDKDDATGPR